MSYDAAVSAMLAETGVEQSTMMGSSCLRYQGDFIGMMFDKEDALIIKVSADRVNALVEGGQGMEFNYTGKRFKEWVMIPLEFQDDYTGYLAEALVYAKGKVKK